MSHRGTQAAALPGGNVHSAAVYPDAWRYRVRGANGLWAAAPPRGPPNSTGRRPRGNRRQDPPGRTTCRRRHQVRLQRQRAGRPAPLVAAGGPTGEIEPRPGERLAPVRTCRRPCRAVRGTSGCRVFRWSGPAGRRAPAVHRPPARHSGPVNARPRGPWRRRAGMERIIQDLTAPDARFHVWDAHTGVTVRRCRSPYDATVAFSPDGRWLVTGSGDLVLGAWQPRHPPAGPPAPTCSGRWRFPRRPRAGRDGGQRLSVRLVSSARDGGLAPRGTLRSS